MMTTPEKFRRRQLVEGLVLILLAVFTVVQSVAFSFEDSDQRECFEEKFSELSYALEARAKLAERESTATRDVLLVYAEAAGILRDDPTKELTPQQQKDLQVELVKTLLRYQDEIVEVAREREQNPVPPYPVGVCEE